MTPALVQSQGKPDPHKGICRHSFIEKANAADPLLVRCMQRWHNKTGRALGGAPQNSKLYVAGSAQGFQLQVCRRNRTWRTKSGSCQVPEADVAAPVQHVEAGQQRVGVEAEDRNEEVCHRASSPPEKAENIEGVCRCNRKVELQQRVCCSSGLSTLRPLHRAARQQGRAPAQEASRVQGCFDMHCWKIWGSDQALPHQTGLLHQWAAYGVWGKQWKWCLSAGGGAGELMRV